MTTKMCTNPECDVPLPEGDKMPICKECAAEHVHEIDGRWIVAQWSVKNQQYTSSDRAHIPESERNSYSFTYARSLKGLVNEGIRAHRSRLEAARATF